MVNNGNLSTPGGPLRVAIVAPSMRILGGQAVQAERLLRAWENDPDVTAWLVPINPLPPKWLRWAVGIKYLRTVVTQLSYWPLLVRELRRADVAHVFSASYFSFILSPLPAVLIAKLLGRRVVVNYRSGEAPDHLARSRVARASLAGVDRVVVPSRFLHEVFSSFGLDAHVVPNVVDLDRFRFRLREPIRPRLVSTRNFEDLYNVACTLRAFALVQAQVPEATLTLVGGGSLDRELRQLAEQLGLRNVTFAGRVQPADVWRYYAEADIYVQTPNIDNMPSSVLEAAASGAVVVSTDAGGVPAIVTNEMDGLLVPVGDEHAAANAVLRVLREPGLAQRLSTAARRRCEQYDWNVIRGQWLALYEQVVARRVEVRPSKPRAASRSRLARLRSMTASEVTFRVRGAVKRAWRRAAAMVSRPSWQRSSLASRLAATPALASARAALGAKDWTGAHQTLARYFGNRPSRFVIDPRRRDALAETIVTHFPHGVEEARAQADRLVAGRFDLLGYTDLDFGNRRETAAPREANGRTFADVDWHLDPVHERRAFEGWWTDIDYLNPSNGDHKVIWELNRQQHWLALGRAYWLSGDPVYKARFVAELESWMRQNPPLTGINWASMLELSFRSLSWVWALHFFLDGGPEGAGGEQPTWLVDLLLGLDRQMRHVHENLSRYFSPNTHLTGEALALYIVGRVFPEFRAARDWEETGRRVLVEEADSQIASDGGHAERSTHYHRYTLDFYLLALAVARRTGDTDAEQAFGPLVIRLAAFARAMADANGYLPRIGDDDAGELMPLCGRAPADVRASLSIAASLLPHEIHGDELCEESLWLAGVDATRHRRRAAPASAVPAGAGSIAFPETGYFVSRSRTGDHMVIDAGPQGFLNGGHAHADALALTLTVRWHRFLIDGGTGTYTMDARARDRFRSTSRHNTLVLNGRDQAEPAGPFHWRTMTDATPICWAENERFDFFEGAHDGYTPMEHRRSVFSPSGDFWLVADHILDRPHPTTAARPTPGTAQHAAAVHWHIDPEWTTRFDGPSVQAVHADGTQVALVTTANRVEVFHADDDSGLGWCSPIYGRVVPCATIRFSRSGGAPFSLASVIAPLTEVRELGLETVPVESSTGDYAYALKVTRRGSVDLMMFRPMPAAYRHGEVAFAGFQTDARFAHVRLSEDGRLVAASLVDGTRLERVTGEPLLLQTVTRVHSLAITIDAEGVGDISPASILSEVEVTSGARVATPELWTPVSTR